MGANGGSPGRLGQAAVSSRELAVVERTEPATSGGAETEESVLRDMLRGYRFFVADEATAVDEAIAVRREVYHASAGQRLEAPDPVDRRSWLLCARDDGAQRVVGTMRMTTREAGPLECEEFFTLPPAVVFGRPAELTRFAILPAYRKGSTFLPIVSVGLFKLVIGIALRQGIDTLVCSAKPRQVWTYEWLGFERTNQVASYGKLGGAEHELLLADFRDKVQLRGHPFREFFVDIEHPEVEVPGHMPVAGAWVDFLGRSARARPAGRPAARAARAGGYGESGNA